MSLFISAVITRGCRFLEDTESLSFLASLLLSSTNQDDVASGALNLPADEALAGAASSRKVIRTLRLRRSTAARSDTDVVAAGYQRQFVKLSAIRLYWDRSFRVTGFSNFVKV